MELGETTAEGAARETSEEAGAHFKMGQLLTVMSVPRVGQVHFADKKAGQFGVHTLNID